jgi:arabinogalactan endo-1,4-beta-galactosidase
MRTIRTLLVTLVTALISGCTIQQADTDEVAVAEQAVAMTMLGADVSTAKRALDLGASYYDAAGVKRTRSTS